MSSQHEFQRQILNKTKSIDTNVATLSGGVPSGVTVSLPVQQNVGDTAVTLLAANPNRCFFRVVNNGPNEVNLCFNAVADLAAPKNTDPPLAVNGVYETPSKEWAQSSLTAICSTGENADLITHNVTIT